jgi:UDP-N-acetylglucosamine 2-epimerase (non-hydrolysing)
VAHVEAGLRTGDLLSPWPEEGNRQLVSRICRWHFAPTGASRENLISEGIPSEKIQVTGNTVIDSLFEMIRRLDDTDLKHSVRDSLMNKGVVFSQRPMILVTGHRRENFGEGFLNICRAINELAEKFPEYDFIYPVHLNPNVQKPVKEILGNQKHIYLIQPAEYAEFVELMRLSTLIISDSGGVQEEAPSLGKPVLVTRNTTERPEAVAAGTVKLVGIDKNVIIKEVTKLLTQKQEYDAMSLRVNPYGDGSSSLRIREILLEGLNEVER